MRLVCNLDELLRQLPMTPAQLAAETGINPKTVGKLRDGKYNWSLKRHQVEKLLILAFDAGLEGFFSLSNHPIWATFEESDALIFRGTPKWDADIEHKVSLFLQHSGGTPRTITQLQPEEEIRRAMTETNCLFVGSPRSNPATEIALCLLSGAQPFDDRPANRAKVPVHILGVNPPPNAKSAILTAGARHGFEVALDKKSERRFVPVHWLPQDEYDRWHGEAEDAAVIIVCRSPLHTTKQVTTILVMGYTGLATQSATRQLTHSQDVPMLGSSQLHAGKVHLLAYEFQFKKPRAANRRSTADPRREISGTGMWSPP